MGCPRSSQSATARICAHGPGPLPVETAAAVVAAVEHREQDVVVPAWLTVPARLNGGLPSLYRYFSRGQGWTDRTLPLVGRSRWWSAVSATRELGRP